VEQPHSLCVPLTEVGLAAQRASAVYALPGWKDTTKAYRAFTEQDESAELTAVLSKTNVPSFMGSEEFVNWAKASFQSLRFHQREQRSPSRKQRLVSHRSLRRKVDAIE
jgi:hypothetical protein